MPFKLLSFREDLSSRHPEVPLQRLRQVQGQFDRIRFAWHSFGDYFGDSQDAHEHEPSRKQPQRGS